MDRCSWHEADVTFDPMGWESCAGVGMFEAKNGGLYCLQHIIEFDKWFEEEARG